MLGRVAAAGAYVTGSPLVPRRVRVCHMTTAHPADDVRVFEHECCSLVAAGFDVHYIVPGAAAGTVEGVVLHSPEKWTGKLGRLRTAWVVYSTARSLEAEIYHAHEPELLPALVLLRRSGAKAIYDSHESLPAVVASRSWVPRRARPLAARFTAVVERAFVRFVDACVSAEEVGSERFPPHKSVLVRNFPTREEVEGACPVEQRDGNVVYAGILNRERCGDVMVEALERLPDHLSSKLVLFARFDSPGLSDELPADAGVAAGGRPWVAASVRGGVSAPWRVGGCGPAASDVAVPPHHPD